MKNFLLTVTIAAMAALLVSGDVYPLSNRSIVRRVSVTPVRCRYGDCDSRDTHGNVRLTYSDGKTVQVTTAGNAEGVRGEAGPKISPDRRTVGWLEGVHTKANTSYIAFYTTRLVLYRDGHVLRTVQGQRFVVEKWFFRNNGRQIALKSRGTHGPAWDELHGTATGRLIAKVYGPTLNRKSPEWARRLGD
jgi:hypothetical protein